jgi:hypothetical protein
VEADGVETGVALEDRFRGRESVLGDLGVHREAVGGRIRVARFPLPRREFAFRRLKIAHREQPPDVGGMKQGGRG